MFSWFSCLVVLPSKASGQLETQMNRVRGGTVPGVGKGPDVPGGRVGCCKASAGDRGFPLFLRHHQGNRSYFLPGCCKGGLVPGTSLLRAAGRLPPQPRARRPLMLRSWFP